MFKFSHHYNDHKFFLFHTLRESLARPKSNVFSKSNPCPACNPSSFPSIFITSSLYRFSAFLFPLSSSRSTKSLHQMKHQISANISVSDKGENKTNHEHFYCENSREQFGFVRIQKAEKTDNRPVGLSKVAKRPIQVTAVGSID